MAARLSIIIPTHDGDGLDRLLASIAPQLADGDEVLIIGDTCDDPLALLAEKIGAMGAPYRFLPYNTGHHCWGHCQLNYGISQATGDYLVFNDDDDIFTPEAFHIIRARIAELPQPRPLMFRFHAARLGRTLPERYEVIESAIGGHCLVTPNIPGKLGAWGERYGGDFDWLVSTLAHWPEGPAWNDDVIADAR